MSRILVLCYEYPPIGGGGGRVAAQVAEALVERGHNVCVVTAGMSHLPRRAMINGVEVIRVCAFRRREDTCSVMEMLLWVAAAFPVAFWEAWRFCPHVIHAHFAVPTGAVAWLVHHLTRIPYVLTAHLGDVPGGVPEQTDQLFRKIKWLTIPIWKSATRVTAVSTFVAMLAERAYRIKTKVILNGIKLPKEQIKKENSIPQLLFVGRLSIQKNPLLVVQALALLQKFSWNLTMIGDGPLTEVVRDEIKKLHLENRIFFQGWGSAENVKAAMERADILLIPSLSEGLPMVGIEALAHGLALIGSRIGGLQDIIEENVNGSFFDLIEGAPAMARELGRFLKDRKALLNAQSCSLEKAQAFQWTHSIDLYEQVLEYIQ